MPKLKQLISLDEDCISILKEQENKSDYVRQAIKHFERTKTIKTPKQAEVRIIG